MQSNERDRFPSFLPDEILQVKDPAALAMASQLRRLPVQLGPEFADKPVETSCAGPGPSSSEQPPFLLIHGFDSSCLEWRRLLPLLHAQVSMKHGIDGHNSTCTRGPLDRIVLIVPIQQLYIKLELLFRGHI